jgi:hypothetical protein
MGLPRSQISSFNYSNALQFKSINENEMHYFDSISTGARKSQKVTYLQHYEIVGVLKQSCSTALCDVLN